MRVLENSFFQGIMRLLLPQSTVGGEDLTPLVKDSKPRWDRDGEIEDQDNTASLPCHCHFSLSESWFAAPGPWRVKQQKNLA